MELRLDPVDLWQLQPLANKALEKIHQRIIKIVMALHPQIKHLPEQFLTSHARE